MNHIDRKFCLLLGQQLTGWKDLGNNRYVFRCPICGDSKKNPNKRRGNIYEVSDEAFFKCHNCGSSKSLYGLLAAVSPSLKDQYRIEKFRGSKASSLEELMSSYSREISEASRKTNPLDNAFRVSSLPEDHKAIVYLRGPKRRISDYWFDDLYYTENLKEFMSSVECANDDMKIPEMEAILIPFFDEGGVLMYIQARNLDQTSSFRYITLKMSPDGVKIWGMDRVNWSRPVFVLEGPFDGMQVDNAVAVAGASIASVVKYLRGKAKDRLILVFDKDFQKNPQLYASYRKCIDYGYEVVAYDNEFVGKDVTETVIEKNWSCDQISNYLFSRTKSGLDALLYLSSFKKPTEGMTWHPETKAPAKNRTTFSITSNRFVH